MRNFRPLPILIALSMTTALAACGASAEPPQRTFTVTGHGEARGAPDIAMITAGVRTQGATAKAALASNTAAMNNVFKTMKSLGIADRDMQTSNFSVQPVYQQYPPGQAGPMRIVGYEVSNQVTVTIRDLTRLGEALDAFVSSGANELGGIGFSIDKPDAPADEARTDAIKDAQHKAEVMARAAGVRLGRLMTLSESGGVRPLPAAPMAMRAEKMSVPIAAGEQQLDADVTLTYEIQ